MDESQSISVEDYQFMGTCFQPWNKTAEYDRRIFVYKFAVVHLAALLNETNLSKRKKKTQLNTCCISVKRFFRLSLSVENFFFFFEFAFTLISSFAIKSEKHK